MVAVHFARALTAVLVLVGWVVYSRLPVREERIRIFSASWASVFLASLACAVQLSVSHAISDGEFGVDATIALPFMLGYHAVIGIGEGVITTGVVAYLGSVSPEILRMPKIGLFTSQPAVVAE